jgi:myo-inositol-1(or 4)-monophosphatase
MIDPLDGFRAETRAAIEAVDRALDLARSRLGATEVAYKGTRDVVTATDVAVEDAVRAAVGEVLGIAVVGEERPGETPEQGALYWLVDPICGTRNFASGIPLYCVNVALVEAGRVTAAVVGDPATGETYVAELARGAWILADGDQRALQVSGESQILVVEDSHAAGPRREQAAQFIAEAVRADRWDLRSFSTTLCLPYVAAGRVAAYVLFWTSAVHAAAGSLLASEAGATVSNLEGDEWTIDSDSIVAGATASLHRELLELVPESP